MNENTQLTIEITLFFLLGFHIVLPAVAAFSILGGNAIIACTGFNIISIFTPLVNSYIMNISPYQSKYAATFSFIRNGIGSFLGIVCTFLSWSYYREPYIRYYASNLFLSLFVSIITVCGTLYMYREDPDADLDKSRERIGIVMHQVN